ncbi:hypothetical protein PoB_007196000 [Plakobranchus ocellatus]|uniref:Mutator-like transposase domain-containing protein n=1 Tax=Plakobranchus ocellatus TaxID=259542 RepID=A0AAV4DNG8_9GAST|nr:hypothetical protein PoB_007196000 [Plakobranchus ocellatus]
MSTSTSTPRVSASKRKLNISQISSDDYCTTMPTTTVDLSTLQPLFSTVLCKECHSEQLSLMWNCNLLKGFSISLFTKCEHCGHMSPSSSTSKKVEAYHEVNRRAVAAGFSIGIVHGQLQHFSEAMDMPGIELLSRCLLGKTQNPNECLHSLIWSRCPKHLFAGLKRVDIATTFAIGEFNEGSRGTHAFLDAAGCFSGTLQRQMGRKRDSARISKCECAADEVQEARRKKRKLAEQREKDFQEQLEGGPMYKSGSF